MTAEIVKDDDVFWAQSRQEQLFDIGAEALAVDRTVEKKQGAVILSQL